MAPVHKGRKKASAKNASNGLEKKINGVDEVVEKEEVVAAVANEEPEMPVAKRGRKKAVIAEVVEEEVSETKVDEEEVTEDKEPEKAPLKRGRKKAVESVDLEEDDKVPQKPVGKRGRPKAVVNEEVAEAIPSGRRGQKKVNVEPVEIDITDSNDEPEKASGKRNRQKSEDASEVEEVAEKASGKRNRQKSEDTSEVEEVIEERAPPAKRGAAAKKEKAVEEDAEDFVPRKTRGRQAKVVAPPPVPKGRKRKAADEKAEVKQSRKGKAVAGKIPEAGPSTKIDEDRQVKVVLERDQDIDEMVRTSSLDEDKNPEVEEDRESNAEEEEAQDSKVEKEEEPKVKSVKGPAKSGRKRANQDPEETKPEKIQKEDAPSKAKGGAKKPQIPDLSVMDFGNTSKTLGGEPWNLKIASWNVNGVRAWLEKNGLSYLHHEKPDILCMQETKCSKDKIPEDLYVEGYYCHWLAGDKEGYSGVGIISKEKPIKFTDGIGLEEHDGEGRVVTAEYDKFYLVTSYVPNSSRALVRLDYRKKWDEDFRAYLKTLDDEKPVILCGDLNVSHNEIDIANPKSNKKSAGFTQEERDGFSALLKEGFVDTFRHLYPDTKDAYTFWTYLNNARAKNIGWRLDYFVISERMKDHLCDSVIRKDVHGSDHCPVALFLNL